MVPAEMGVGLQAPPLPEEQLVVERHSGRETFSLEAKESFLCSSADPTPMQVQKALPELSGSFLEKLQLGGSYGDSWQGNRDYIQSQSLYTCVKFSIKTKGYPCPRTLSSLSHSSPLIPSALADCLSVPRHVPNSTVIKIKMFHQYKLTCFSNKSNINFYLTLVFSVHKYK